ncbi:MAG: hypothetical protein D6798_16195 [Deltaproteobacteria bacterium]|nr:MAG: hypothetical protein D6798_16195 [Deltaproteobacteria bacterium]
MGGPQLELDWEEGLFRALRGFWRRLARRPAPIDQGRAATLASLERRLSVLASLVAGAPIRVLPARGRGGLRGDDLLLPPTIDIAPDAESNAGLYLLGAVVGGAIHRLQPDVPRDPAERESASARVLDQAVAVLVDELPAFGPAWDAARDLERRAGRAESCLWGALIPVDGDRSERIGDEEGTAPPAADSSQVQAPPVEELHVHDLDEEEALALPVHSFEKVEMAEPFNGTLRQLDGEDDLQAHLEALEEVPLGDLLRGGPQAHSLIQADIALDADIPDVAHVEADEPFESYDEWDGRRRRYRPGWCRVYPTALPRGDDAWAAAALQRHRRTVETLYGQVLRHRDRLRAAPRQADGEDVDIDAVTDAWATIAAGHSPTDRLYVRQARQERDLATTVLLDVSLSTDAWVDDRRVLDVARESVLVLGEVADRLGDALQVIAFASHTRHRVRAWTVRDWHEPWRIGRGRLGLLRPQGYTRIGPALRYATAQLCATSARHRLLLLVSDGKPTDYDRYEGRYGMADVRQALREAARAGVRTHALAIDAVAQDWLPAMLGPGAWSILPHPADLPAALTRAWGRLR